MADYRMGPSGGHGDPNENTFEMFVPPGKYLRFISFNIGEKFDSITIKWGEPGPPEAAFEGALTRGGGPGRDHKDVTLDTTDTTRSAIQKIYGRFGTLIETVEIFTSKNENFPVLPRGRGGWNDYEYNTPAKCHVVGFFGTIGGYGGAPVISSLGVIYRDL